MRIPVRLLAAAIVCLTGLTLADSGLAGSLPHKNRPPMTGFEDLPKDDRSLARLERRHKQILQHVTKQCALAKAASGNAGNRNPAYAKQDNCQKNGLDQLIARERDPGMRAYHGAISASRRYDPGRESQYWRNVKRSAESGRMPR